MYVYTHRINDTADATGQRDCTHNTATLDWVGDEPFECTAYRSNVEWREALLVLHGHVSPVTDLRERVYVCVYTAPTSYSLLTSSEQSCVRPFWAASCRGV